MKTYFKFIVLSLILSFLFACALYLKVVFYLCSGMIGVAVFAPLLINEFQKVAERKTMNYFNIVIYSLMIALSTLMFYKFISLV